MLKAIAATKYGFFQTGSFNKLSFSESEFIALNISTVTKIDKLMVVARCAMAFVNMSQPISGKSDEHLWKCVCIRETEISWGCAVEKDHRKSPVGRKIFVAHRCST
jgi:TPP-dependent trihydroxycyclohexane-1,2-dione (THcHDO) dehydratase